MEHDPALAVLFDQCGVMARVDAVEARMIGERVPTEHELVSAAHRPAMADVLKQVHDIVKSIAVEVDMRDLEHGRVPKLASVDLEVVSVFRKQFADPFEITKLDQTQLWRVDGRRKLQVRRGLGLSVGR